MKLFIFSLVCYGLTMIIVQSAIMRPVRNYFDGKIKMLTKMLICMMCTGFWVSILAVILLNWSMVNDWFDVVKPIGTISSALAETTIITFVYLLQTAVEKKYDIDW